MDVSGVVYHIPGGALEFPLKIRAVVKDLSLFQIPMYRFISLLVSAIAALRGK
jgi:hypothetical protein